MLSQLHKIQEITFHTKGSEKAGQMFIECRNNLFLSQVQDGPNLPTESQTSGPSDKDGGYRVRGLRLGYLEHWEGQNRGGRNNG